MHYVQNIYLRSADIWSGVNLKNSRVYALWSKSIFMLFLQLYMTYSTVKLTVNRNDAEFARFDWMCKSIEDSDNVFRYINTHVVWPVVHSSYPAVE